METVFLIESCQRDKMMKSAEDFVKKQAIFDCFTSFCMLLNTLLYGAMTTSISCLNFRHLFMKW